ncbi:MAG TPA: hypothetical protein VEB70_07740 [Noviherbaspirillum sp.]|nr:hypothetical protein [Noviherbaspirillum sp.]
MKHQPSRKADAKKAAQTNIPVSPFAGRPLDGSQYIDVVEEQEYADRRPTAEEQRPRFSYLHDPKSTKN